MTQTSADLGFSREADARLAEYLAQVRAALAGVPDVNPDEIEADIREHVENELRTAVRPVALLVLEAVLRRLGPPTQWLPPGWTAPPAEVPSLGWYLRHRVRRTVSALWRGPEDWRLPYLAFGVFALGVLAFPLFPLFLILSYILARAEIAVAAEKGIALGGARKWLLYPPVAIVSTVLLLAVVAVPFGLSAVICTQAHEADWGERWELAGRPHGRYQVLGPWGGPARFRPSNPELMTRFPKVVTTLDRLIAGFPGNREVREVLAVAYAGVGVFAAWGAVFGLLAGRFPGTVRAVFCPLCNGFEGRFARRVGLVCLLVLAVWGGFACRLLTDAGLM